MHIMVYVSYDICNIFIYTDIEYWQMRKVAGVNGPSGPLDLVIVKFAGEVVTTPSLAPIHQAMIVRDILLRTIVQQVV